MKSLFDDTNIGQKSTDVNNEIGWLCFQGGKKIKIQARGKHGVYYGYLTIVDGLFSVADLSDDCNGMQFFVSDNVDIELGNIRKCKPTIVMAESFLVNEKNANFASKNIVLVSNFQPEQISLSLNGSEEYTKFNSIKCCLYFKSNDDNISNEDVAKIELELNKMPDKIQNVDFFVRQKWLKPYFLNKNKHNQDDFAYGKKVSSLKQQLHVAVLDFGVSHSLKWLLDSYFDVSILPYNETLQQLLYLYQNHKIDGIVVPDFTYNTSFIDEKICNEMRSIINSKIPVLSVAGGAIFVAELLGGQTKIDGKIFTYNTFPIRDLDNKIYNTTYICDKTITDVPSCLHCDLFDLKGRIVGYSNIDKNIIGYNFSLSKKNIENDLFISRYAKMIKKQNKKRKEVWKILYEIYG